MKKLSALRKSKKGFTLVEIIVVLVILAILAAIAIPTMSGYIDDAKEKQILAEASSVLTAVKTEAISEYGKDGAVLYSDIEVADLNKWIGSAYVTAVVDTTSTNADGEVAITVTTKGEITNLIYVNDGYAATYDGSAWSIAEVD